jgi:hypothetical protein
MKTIDGVSLEFSLLAIAFNLAKIVRKIANSTQNEISSHIKAILCSFKPKIPYPKFELARIN